MTKRVPETRDELEGRAPDDAENRPHLPLWEALLFFVAGLFLLLAPETRDLWTYLRGGGLVLVGLASLIARGTRARLGNATPLIALVGVFAFLTGVVAWLVQKVF